ncbi:MAG: toprim domain-containing protein, partial [Butyricicoccus sp.]
MIKIKEAILVEGRYDINTLRQLVDTVILETGGFRIFKDRERLDMIRKIAARRGILILTDSDGAGCTIRSFLRGALPREQVKHAYVPEIMGKEARKRRPSKEGKLGVEGMPQDILLRALQRAGATFLSGEEKETATDKLLVKADLYALGLSGTSGSEKRRKALLAEL